MCTEQNVEVPATGWVGLVFRITVLMEGAGDSCISSAAGESVCADASWQMAFVSNGWLERLGLAGRKCLGRQSRHSV